MVGGLVVLLVFPQIPVTDGGWPIGYLDLVVEFALMNTSFLLLLQPYYRRYHSQQYMWYTVPFNTFCNVSVLTKISYG